MGTIFFAREINSSYIQVEISIFFDWGSSYLVVSEQANKTFRCCFQLLLVFKLNLFIIDSSVALKYVRAYLFTTELILK
jgi:hypothetical protein